MKRPSEVTIGMLAITLGVLAGFARAGYSVITQQSTLEGLQGLIWDIVIDGLLIAGVIIAIRYNCRKLQNRFRR